MFSTCNTCDSHCFPTPATCVEWNGNTHADLNIRQHDSLVVVMEAMIAEIKRIGEIVDDCKFCSSTGTGSSSSNLMLPAPRYGIGTTYTSNKYAVQQIPASYAVKREDTDHKVSYNLNPFEGALPSTSALVEVQVQAVSGKTGSITNTLYQSSEKAGGFNISPANLPVDMTIQAKVRSNEGDVLLTKSVTLTGAEEGDYNFEFEANAFNGTPSEISVDTFNDIISGELAKLKRDVENLKNQ